MSRPRWLLVLPVALIVVLVTAGGLYWSGRDGETPPPESAQAVGVDLPPEAARPDAAVIAQLDEAARVEEWARRIEDALYEQRLADEAAAAQAAAEAAAAYAAARREDEAIAADAVRRWGSGQLLLAIPRIGITAAVTPFGLERDGKTPATPNTPWGVAWYWFTSAPGTGGNAVFSGHVDWYTGAPAVFGRLRNVGVGDGIYIVTADGTPIAYEVASSEWVDPNRADLNAIFGATEREAVTFITCVGTWNAVTHDYSHRLIVRAYRVR